jgi:hypothetical protein
MKILAVSFEVRAGISFEQGTLDLLPALTVYHPAREIIGGQNERQ